ncbi:MAG: hypothetical protein QM790_15945 [Nibricoccus sp.]
MAPALTLPFALSVMGFFDRFTSNKDNPQPSDKPNGATPPPPGSVQARLLAAREKLEAKDLNGALEMYEELLITSGDRPDVLVAVSGDLGSCGYVDQIVELVAPRYDAERHGPATGLNLLQAYLATRNTTAAQHLLDILFALKQPEIEDRLYGFSNALAELLEAERRGQLPPPPPSSKSDGQDDSASNAEAQPRVKTVSLVSISRPVWSYGLDGVPGILPQKEGRNRRIAFAQLALPDVGDWLQRMGQPEDDLARLSRGIPLWLHESMYFCPHYTPIAAIAMMEKDHYGIFGAEWTTDNIRQLVDTCEGGLDYVFTGALRHKSGDYSMVLRLWEIKKFRERKTFQLQWTPATANSELMQLHDALRMFMEFKPYPDGSGLNYAPPPNPFAWCDTLGTCLSFFLAEKGVLPKEQIASPAENLARIAARAASSETASLAWLALRDRAPKIGVTQAIPPDAPLNETPLVLQAKEALGL